MQCFSRMVKICVEEVAVNTTISSCLVTKKLKITFDIMLCILRMAQKIGLAVIRTRHQIKLCVTMVNLNSRRDAMSSY